MRIRKRSHKNISLVFIMIPLLMASFTAKCRDKRPERNEQEIAVDNLINVKVRENLTASQQVRAINIGVHTFKLKVTLDGTVSSEAERDEAVRITRQTEVEKDGTKFKVKDVDSSNLKIAQQ